MTASRFSLPTHDVRTQLWRSLMVEMPMMPTTATADPIGSGDAAAVSDAPRGAFEEMLARRLGRQLVGRFAEDDGQREPNSGGSGDATSSTSDVPAPPTLVQDPAPLPDVAPSVRPIREGPPTGGVAPTPVRVHVNRPGFPTPMAEPGIIQPGPTGEVWTHPSGFADLQLTRQGGERLFTAAASAPKADSIAEPPIVHWSPSPARAALAAAANRDLELDIVTQLRGGLEQPQVKPALEIVKAEVSAIAPPHRMGQEQTQQSEAGGTGVAAVLSSNVADVATGTPSQAPQVQQSVLVERIMTAVELQRHLPPPRAIAIEIPEMEGLRLVVTMRMDGSLHIGSSTPGQAALPEQAVPLLQAVNEALTERGFDMSADTGGRQGARQDTDDPARTPQAARTPRFRRSVRRAGLRL